MVFEVSSTEWRNKPFDTAHGFHEAYLMQFFRRKVGFAAMLASGSPENGVLALSEKYEGRYARRSDGHLEYVFAPHDGLRLKPEENAVIFRCGLVMSLPDASGIQLQEFVRRDADSLHPDYHLEYILMQGGQTCKARYVVEPDARIDRKPAASLAQLMVMDRHGEVLNLDSLEAVQAVKDGIYPTVHPVIDARASVYPFIFGELRPGEVTEIMEFETYVEQNPMRPYQQ